ncbi:hypothetical protein [Streptomyces sp. NPDC002221]|uniref:hypothetical protein n=1 Tax=Streptomyces sp. NPDC002221 TaxID=3364639 RepID=UPI00369EC8B8
MCVSNFGTAPDPACGLARVEQYVRELVRYQHAIAQYRKWQRTAPPLKTFTVTITAPMATIVRALDEDDARRTAMAGSVPSPGGTITRRLTGPSGYWIAEVNGTASAREVRR